MVCFVMCVIKKKQVDSFVILRKSGHTTAVRLKFFITASGLYTDTYLQNTKKYMNPKY